MAIAILYREESREYDFGPGHPLRGDRFEIFARFLKQRLPEGDNYRFVRAGPATEEDLLLICNKDYVDFTRDYFKAASLGLPFPNPERFFQYHSGDNLPAGRTGKIEEAARLMVGQVKMAADLILAGEYQKTVCIGGNQHHAKPNYGEGFCIYNDNAFAGKYLIGKYGLDRILILDTDAHAGNGTAEYFYEEPRVLFIDLHQDPATLYPGTGSADEIGAGRGKGFTINIPLPIHAGYDSYRLAFEAVVEPVTREFRPQIIIRNGGSDPHFADELTSLGLPVSGFTMIG
jgi:acetoin utilization protein AcuC